MTPWLLVSVVGADEVAAALEGGADVIDVKDPAAGSLGAASPAVLAAVRARVPSAVALSAAIGDEPLPGVLEPAARAAAAGGARYVKLGVRGVASGEDAVALLEAVRRGALAADPRALVVAVAYADAARVGGLPPRELPAVAARAGIHGVMLDTAVKDGASSFDVLDESEIEAFVASARALGLRTALAGALRLADAARCARLGVDVFGVRGAACDGGRAGRVSAARVRALREALTQRAAASPALARS